jgi:hemolysin activation/secretion protein
VRRVAIDPTLVPTVPLKPLLGALLVALCAPSFAQGAAPVVPDAGAILRQIQPPRPPAPPSSGTGLRIEKDNGAPAPASVAFEVKTLQISGNTVFDTPTLHALVADAEGKRLTLAQLLAIAARITDYYQAHGYPLARAIIRAQVIRNGVVGVDVLEARYGKIALDNRSQVNDALLQATLASLHGGQLVSQSELDRALLLMSDIPGIVPDPTLRPGDTVGTSDLQVEVAPGPAVVGSAAVDNFGNRYTGRARLDATVDVVDPLHHGDVLSANVLDSGRGLAYGRLAYEWLLDGAGTRVGGSYSALHYRLDGALAALDAHGTAGIASLWAKNPLLRSRDADVYGQIRIDRLQLRDRVDAASIRNDRNLDTVGVSLTGDARDALLYGAVDTWNVDWTGGRLQFQDDTAKAADASTARTQGGFSTWHTSLARLQNVSPADAVYVAVSGQWSPDNLDSSQKMSVGGPYSVRAYDVGALSGDRGILATVEVRRRLAFDNGRWQMVAFIDSAALRIDTTPWAAGRNNATLSGAGFGLDWAGPDRWQVKASVATTVGAKPELVGSTASTRAWLEVREAF